MILSYLGEDLLGVKVGEISTLASSIIKTFSLKKGHKIYCYNQTVHTNFRSEIQKNKLTMLSLKVKRTDVLYLAPGY